MSAVELIRSRLLFIGVCFYLISQAFTVPIAAIGPSWAVWPTLSDFAVGLVAIGRLAVGRWNQTSSPSNAAVLRWFVVFTGVCVLSYLAQTVLIGGLTAGPNSDSKAVILGGFSLYRSVEFIIVLWGASALPFTRFRRRAILVISTVAFVAVCAGVIATFFSIVLTSRFAAHLPNDRVSGAWLYYLHATGEGLGTIGYNHTYVSAQIVLLAALSLHMMDGARRGVILKLSLLFLGLFAVFLTGSRMGLMTMLLFCGVGICWVAVDIRPYAVILGLLLLLAVAPVLPWEDSTVDLGNEQTQDIYARQESIFHAFNRQSYSGRDEIWKDRLEYLNGNPLRWLFGGGLGSAADAGGNAHMQVLQIVSELGLAGLVVWAAFFVGVIRSLWLRECHSHVIFWATVCLLLSCVSQETFYPVPALGHFLGFYLLSVAIALRPAEEALNL